MMFPACENDIIFMGLRLPGLRKRNVIRCKGF